MGMSHPFPAQTRSTTRFARCRLGACAGPRTARVDDQVAVVPRRFLGAYFADLAAPDPKRERRGKRRPEADREGCACCALTRSLVARNASLAPLALPFTIVRDAPGRFRGGWAPSPLDGGLFADAALAADWARPPRAARALRCDPALVKQLG